MYIIDCIEINLRIGKKMMDFSRISISKPEFDNHQKSLLKHQFHVDVVLIDKSTSANPQVFQLTSELSSLSPNQLRHSYDRQHFNQLGELFDINTSGKVIRLTNQIIVSYKYLIEFIGYDHPPEISKGLLTLIEAMHFEESRIKEKISHKGPKRNSKFPNLQKGAPDASANLVIPKIAEQKTTFSENFFDSSASFSHIKL